MPDYHIGILDKEAMKALNSGSQDAESDSTRAVFLQAKAWSKAVLDTKVDVSHDSKIFSFRLDHDEQTFGLPVGMHVLMRLRDPATRKAIIRAYTPISYGDAKGRLDLVVKIYRKTATRPGGEMTQALDSIPLGHYVDFKGPVGKFIYNGNGNCTVLTHERHFDRFIMICGGSGVTPIFQILRAVTDDASDKTECLVMNGNRFEEDILCREEIDDMVARAPKTVRLINSLTKPSDTWKGRRGRMDKDFFATEVGPPGRRAECKSMVLVCGPEALERGVLETFTDMGWNEDDILFF